jgi:selenoprotein W-related protein
MVTKMTTKEVLIRYCVPCGHLPKAIALIKDILNSLGKEMNKEIKLTIVPWDGGVFEVWINGELVFNRKEEGGFPDSRAIVDLVRSKASN